MADVDSKMKKTLSSFDSFCDFYKYLEYENKSNYLDLFFQILKYYHLSNENESEKSNFLKNIYFNFFDFNGNNNVKKNLFHLFFFFIFFFPNFISN